MQRSFDFRVPEPAASGRRASCAAAAPPTGAEAAGSGRRAGSDRSAPENPDR